MSQTTAQKINQIIEKNYNGYRGRVMWVFREQHRQMRKLFGDDKFLRFLEDLAILIPEPEYKPISLQNDKKSSSWPPL